MDDYDDNMVARSALEQGAFLFLPKPIKMEDVKYLWQHLWREKTRKIKEKEQIGEVPVFNRMSNGFGAEGQIPLENITNDDDDVAENGSKSRKKGRKVRTEWTQELHDKFVDAIIELGEGRCYPKEILELMNEPGLTRLQVASHLQKCRKGSWRPNKERKGHYINIEVSPEIKATNLKRKNFGSMPVLIKHLKQQNLQINENSEKIQDRQIYSLANNNVFDYHPQVESQKNVNGFTFSQDNVEAPYMEQDGTNLLTVPGAFMPNEQFMSDFDSVTSGDLQAFDIDRPNEPGSSHRGTDNERV
ncbi:two-component response regulator ARR14-like [Olea europaea subsp. europaea]|uniref:Two-component response regulator ARR14-like n=1 Tax=Olea europaea subsp. europaea TaxID=158383 RepID=A0A8S0T609_OLEEU|nr:two-component response regulator ARR14-like [Olea europaea subsp. europaea]